MSAWSDRRGVLGTNLAPRRIISWITPCNAIQWTPHNTLTFVVWSFTQISGSGQLEFPSCMLNIWNGSGEVDYAAWVVRGLSLEIFIQFCKVKNWSELNCGWHYFKLTMAAMLREGQNSKLFTATFQADRGDFLILKRPSQQKQKHHFNNSLSEVVFTLVWLVWHHFLLTDVFTSSSFLPLSICLLASCGNECQTNNVSYLEARTRQEVIVCSELKYHGVWRGI